jgi:probable O-glycosylation ligase (exosortase A-associated)
MKQTIYLILMTLIGTFGVFLVEPFWGVAVYDLFAVLRPQNLWDWALPRDRYSWSRYVAFATIAGLLCHKFGLLTFPTMKEDDERGGKQRGAVHYCMMAFGFWLTLSYAFGPYYNPAWTDEVAFEYFKIFVMFFTSSMLVRRFRQVWVLYLLTTLALIYISWEMNDQYLSKGYLFIYKVGFAGLDNNGAALMLATGVPLCLFMWEGLERWYRWLFLAAIPIIIHAVLMSYSRGAMVALIVASPIWVLRSRKRAFLGLAFVGMICLLPLLAGKQIQDRFFTLEKTDADSSAQSRWRSWEAAYRMANDHPLLGVGLRGANILSYQYGADYEGRSIHSLYLEIAADNGWVGLGLYLSMCFSAWLSLRRARRLLRERQDPEGQKAYAVCCGVEGSLVVFFVGATFLSLEVFELPYVLFLICAQLPLVAGVAPEPEAAPPETSEEEMSSHDEGPDGDSPDNHAEECPAAVGWDGTEA